MRSGSQMVESPLGISIPTSHSLVFVREFLPAPPASLIEVGAGTGELSVALAALRYSVIPIDSAPDAVAAMQSGGLNAVLASWPDYAGPQVAAVIFSRTLHHLPLDTAVSHAKSHLDLSGRLIVEDFAFSEMPDTALEWLRSLLARLVGEGVCGRRPTDFSRGSWPGLRRPSITGAREMRVGLYSLSAPSACAPADPKKRAA